MSKTTVVNIKTGAKFDVYIGRGTKYGNRFSHIPYPGVEVVVESREEAIKCYRNWLKFHPELIEAAKKELKGRVLGCSCSPRPCHGDIWVEILDKED